MVSSLRLLPQPSDPDAATSHLSSFSPLATSFLFYLIVVWAHCTLVVSGTTLVKRLALCTFSRYKKEQG